MEGALSRINILAQTKGLTLTSAIAPDMPAALVGDQARLQQILVNLVGNAVKFTQTGTVKVCFYRPDPAHWAFQVSDTGPGIPPESLSRIFERFYRVDDSRSRQGVGLGLAIVKWIVEAHHGTIHVKSEVGTGSSFTILLPLASSARAVSAY